MKLRCLNAVALCCAVLFSVTAICRAEIPIEVTYQDAAGTGFFDNTPRTAVGGNSGTTLGEQRRNALLAALNHWSKMLNGSVPIKVRAIWLTQGTSTLASATPLAYAKDFTGVPVAGRYYPSALANQLAGQDLDTSRFDIQVNCNKDWDDGTNDGLGDSRKWYYGFDGLAPGDDFDFYSTMLHEIGHGLGFGSFLQTDGSWANSFPNIFDNFLANGTGTLVTSMNQSLRAAITTSGNLYTAGSYVAAINNGHSAKIHAPSTYQPGSSGSHLDEDTYSYDGSIDECLTPVSSFATHTIGPLVLAVFQDLGYTLIDNLPPTVSITTPTSGGSYNSALTVSGTAADTASGGTSTSVGLWKVRVALARSSDSAWWNWPSNNWGSSTFDYNTNVKLASATLVPISRGTTSWSLDLPTLPDGSYQVQASAVDQLDNGSEWTSKSFSIDTVQPVIAFYPLQDGDTVFDFSKVAGALSKSATVTLRIIDRTDGDLASKLWNGSAWTSDSFDPDVDLATTINGTIWVPSATLPSRSQIRLGNYRLIARCVDAAGNTASTTINVYRSAADTTLPIISVTSPLNNQTFTNNFLPTLSGTASDPESGVTSVTAFLMKFADSTITYWTGSSWSASPATITVSYDGETGGWQSSGALPSGFNLPNGSYQLQVTAYNGENPSGAHGTSVSFSVDYHPIYNWTQGSYNDGISGNENNRWDNPANWDNGVPPAEAVVNIGGGTCDASPAYVSVYKVNLTGGTLTVSGMTVKFLNVSAGTLAGGTVQIDTDGRFNWAGGTLQPGTFNIPVTGVLTISSSNSKQLYDSTINNSGTIIWTGGNVYGQHGWFVNGPTGLFDAQADATLNLYPNFGDGNRGFTNYGVFRKSAGIESLHQGYFNNYGVVEIQTGAFTLYDSFTLQDGSSIAGNGKVRLINGCCGINAEVYGNTSITGCLELSESNTHLRARTTGTVNVGSTGILRITQGTISGGLTLNGNGSIQWNGGGFEGTNTITSGTTVTVSGSSQKLLGNGAVLNNYGTINWNGTAALYQDGRSNYGYAPATLNNLAGATFRVLNEGYVFSHSGTPSTFNNASGATFIKSGNANPSYISDWVVNNNGAVQCNTGTFDFIDVNAATFFNGGTAVSGAGSLKFEGDVRITGSLTSDATIDLSGGTLTGTTNSMYSGAGLFRWNSGVIAGSFNLDTNATMEVAGSGTKYLGSSAIWNNAGTVKCTGVGQIYNYGRSNYGETPATINNLAGATFYTLTNTVVFGVSGTRSIFNNLAGATLVRDGDTNTTYFGDFELLNAGTIQVVHGALELNTVSHFQPNGRFTGAGEIRPTVTVFVSGTNFIDTALLKMPSGELIGVATNNATLTTTNNGSFEWSGGNISEVLNIASNSTMRITGPNTKYFSSAATLNNRGSVLWTGAGEIYNYGRSSYSETPAIWNNLSGATFSASNDVAFNFAGTASVFNNATGAVFQKIGGTNTTTVFWMLNNAGLVHALIGKIDLAGDGSDSGTYLADSNATIRFAGGNRVFSGTTQLTGSGKIQLDGTTINATGPVNFGVGNEATIFEIISGTLQGSASFTGLPIWNWLGGTISGNLTVPGGTTLNISGASAHFLGSGAVFNNQGTVNWSGPAPITCDGRSGYGMSPCIFNNLSGGTFRILTDGQVFQRYGDYSTFNNANGASIVKAAGTDEALLNSFVINNAGAIRATSGILTLNDFANFDSTTILDGASLIRLAGENRVTNAISAFGNLRVDAGTVTGITNDASTMRLSGPVALQWWGGTLAGNITLSSNVTMDVSAFNNANTLKVLGSSAVLNNEGIINWTGPAPILCDGRASYSQAPCILNNRSNAQFRMLSDGVPFQRYGDMSTFNNEAGALFVKVAGTNETTVNAFVVNNRGEIRNDAGILRFNEVLNLDSVGRLNAMTNPIYLSGTTTTTNSLTALGTVCFDTGTFIANGAPEMRYQGPGTFEWAGGSIFGNITIASNVVANIFTPGGANVSKTLGSAAVLNNEGSINWTGPGAIFCDGRSSYGQSAGIINNRSGAAFRMWSDGTVFLRYGDYTPFNNQSGALFEKADGTNITTINNFMLNNSGIVRAAVGILEYSDLTVLKNGGTFRGPGSHLMDGGTVLLQGTTTADATSLTFSAGYLNAMISSNATFATINGGSIAWTGGTIGGDLSITTASSFDIAGANLKAFDSAAVLRNKGTIRWLGSGDIFADGRLNYGYQPATIYNESGAMFSIEGDANFSMYAAGHVFNNQAGATLRKTTATGTTTFNWTLNNNGSLDLQSGTINSLTHTFASSSALNLRFAGTGAGSNYGVLTLPNGSTLQGNCSVSLDPSYTPADGDSFTVVTYGSHSGQFAPVNLPTLPYPLQWKTTYGANSLVFAVQRAHLLSPPTLLGNGEYQLSLTGPSATSAVLQISTNLVDWKPVATNTPFSGAFDFVDNSNATNRFYRIQIVP